MTVINLNQFRKARRKAEARAAAGLNRVKHGRPKAEKKRDAAETAKHAELVDGAKLDGGPERAE